MLREGNLQKIKGKLITFEGCEGVGKSTQIALLKEYCVKNNIDAVFTREPGGSVIAEELRKIILEPDNKIDPITELMLYAAARREHICQLIAPALQQGKTVFCDRFIDSTVAYQGYGRGLSLQNIESLNQIALSILKKDGGYIDIDLTVFFDLEPAAGFARKGGANPLDRMDSEDIAFHKKVYNGYLEISKKEKKRVVKVDASGGPTEIFERVLTILRGRGVL